MQSLLLDAAGHRRSPATMPGYHRDRPPRNKGEHHPADPPTVEEIIEVMRTAGDTPDGRRLRALIVVLWRAGLRISEALALQESELDPGFGAGSHRISSDTLTPWKWRTKAYRSSSSRGNWGTRTSGSPRSTPRHRRLGDHRHGPPTALADDLSHRRAAPRAVGTTMSGRH